MVNMKGAEYLSSTLHNVRDGKLTDCLFKNYNYLPHLSESFFPYSKNRIYKVHARLV